MFTRSSSGQLRAEDPRPANPRTANGVVHRTGPSESGKSVIGNDLKIVGQGLRIISQGVLQVDGEIEGDVHAAEVIVGEQGKVTGTVTGQQVIIRGKVCGVVCGKTIALQNSSDVEGDIHHMALTIEQGAMFDGRSRRLANEAELISIMDTSAAVHKTG
jgi:cytoskeletal protein CcmA (bactofilin family)